MRIVRLAALFGSLVLLVATSVAVVNRRGDVRNAQIAEVELGSSVTEESVRASLNRISQLVGLAAVSMIDSAGADDRSTADELVRLVPGSVACVGASQAGCTGPNLLSFESVSDLAVLSAQGAGNESDLGSNVTIAVDSDSDTVLAVRRIVDGERRVTVVLQAPIDGLVSEAARSTIADTDLAIGVMASARSNPDEFGLVESRDGQRVVVDLIGSRFDEGSLVITTSIESDIGLAGDRTFRYLTFLAVGTVLLALAGWTFLVERRQLEKRATTDDLTQLINRREFERVSEEALDMADRFNTGLCVMVIDLNGFKQINDRLGHQFGDLVLTAASERFVDAVRDTDIVGRWGGDEFVILLPGLSERTAVRNSAERIWNRLAESPVVGDTTITASIGAAIFPRHGTTLDALMRAADVAMYEAKTTGVSHRIADTIAVGESLLTPDGVPERLPSAEPEVSQVVTDEYAGPDRRRSPVPPPPLPPPGSGAGDPAATVRDPSPRGAAERDETSIH